MGETTTATGQPTFVPEPVAAWRRQRLREAGVPRQLASRLAADGRYDVHSLIDLLEHGCPPDLAVRIVAPLDEPGPE